MKPLKTGVYSTDIQHAIDGCPIDGFVDCFAFCHRKDCFVSPLKMDHVIWLVVQTEFHQSRKSKSSVSQTSYWKWSFPESITLQNEIKWFIWGAMTIHFLKIYNAKHFCVMTIGWLWGKLRNHRMFIMCCINESLRANTFIMCIYFFTKIKRKFCFILVKQFWLLWNKAY